MYFPSLRYDLLQIPVPHRKKIWSQHSLLLALPDGPYAKELTAACYSSSRFIGCYQTSPVTGWVVKSLGPSLFISITSNFADSFSFFLGESYFKPLSRCDAALQSLSFSKAITYFLTVLFLPSPQHMRLPPFPCYTRNFRCFRCCKPGETKAWAPQLEI